MGFLKKFGNGIGRFGRKIASSGLGKTLLTSAATAFGGPVAGAAVLKVTSLLGQNKTEEMAQKVAESGTVKVDKVQETLKKLGIHTDLNEVVFGLKAAAEGAQQKSVSITKGSVNSVENENTIKMSIKDRIENTYFKAKNWITDNKTIAIVVGLAIALGVVVYFFVYKRKPKYVM